MEFRYDPQLLTRFPSICGGGILAPALENGPTPPELAQAFLDEQRRVVERLGNTPLSELPSLAAWRGAFRAFGVDPTRYRSAAEALLRRLTKKGDLPSVNALVDLCNLVSIRYALPVAAFDARAISGPVTVCSATGRETFIAHDQEGPENPDPGEVIFICGDPDRPSVIARRWCWKQSLESAVQPDTGAAILTVEAHHEGGRQDVQAALDDLQALLARYAAPETAGAAPSGWKAGLIGPQQPGIASD
jgi:DNA/RNA-binding domain of Phe-tRNA-synthetase-like protein